MMTYLQYLLYDLFQLLGMGGMENWLYGVCYTYILSGSIVVITVNAALLGVKLCVGVFLWEEKKERKNFRHYNTYNLNVFAVFLNPRRHIQNILIYMQPTTCWFVQRAVKFATGHQASYFISLMKINKRIAEKKNMIESKAPKTSHKLLYIHTHTHLGIYVFMNVYLYKM